MKYPLTLILFTIGVQILYSGCKKDDSNSDHPLIETLMAKAVTPTKVALRGKLQSSGKVKVLDHGFEYDFDFHFDTPRRKLISLGSSKKVGDFTAMAEGLNPGYEGNTRDDFYVRAYYKNSEGIVYGNPVNLKLPRVSPQSLSPLEGKAGDKITIKGNLYAGNTKDVKVLFEQKEAKIISATDQEIIVEVPSNIPLRHKEPVRVDLQIDGQTVMANNSFVILASFADFSPKSGPIGTLLSFTGLNLPAGFSTVSNIQIKFGGLPTWLSTGEQFTTRVPETQLVDNMISATVNGVEVVLPGHFTLTPPVITSLSPLVARPGELLILNGSNFPFEAAISAEGFVGTVMSSSSAYSDNFQVYVPPMMAPGTYPVTITTGPFKVTAPQQVTVKAHQVSDFSPSIGFPGDEVHIRGTFKKDNFYRVYFGDEQTTGKGVFDGEMVVKVPLTNHKEGLKVAVNMSTEILLPLPGTFTIKGPVITSFSPKSGLAGTEVTVTGKNFRKIGECRILLGGISFPVDDITETKIRFTIPISPALGDRPIKVEMAGQLAVSEDVFNVPY